MKFKYMYLFMILSAIASALIIKLFDAEKPDIIVLAITLSSAAYGAYLDKKRFD